MKSLSALLLTLLLCSGLFAQLTRGFISGTVQDSSGGSIEAVTVTITNLDTNIKRDTTTNSAGVYRFVGVEPGEYSVAFSKSGFESKGLGRISVGTTQEVVVNNTLAIAAMATEVEVKDAPAGVELAKSSATIERTFRAERVESLPTIGATRDVTRLTLLAPTVARATGATVLSANGQRSRNNNFTIDGVDNNDVGVGVAAVRIIPEQVAEFQAQTSAYSAEFGRNNGAQISTTTKSGTNSFHGDVYDYFAADWMESLTLAQKRTGVYENPRYVQNEPGANVGGRIIKDRTFFFSLIDTTQRNGSPSLDFASPITIPTPEGLAALANAPLGPDQTTQSRQATLGALGFLKDIYPQIHNYDSKNTVNVNGVPVQVGTTRIPLFNPVSFWTVVNRIDHQLTSKDSLSYRNAFDKQERPNIASNTGFGNKWSAAQNILSQTHSLSETRVFSPRLMNEFRASFSRKNLAFPENDPNASTVLITAAFNIGGLNNFPQGRIQNTLQFQNIATYLAGRHSWKMGVDFRRLSMTDTQGADTKGTWRFDTLADFINSRASRVTQAVNTASSEPRQNLTSLFFQDDFRATPNLTLSVGLRYEMNTLPFGLFGVTDPALLAIGVPGPAQPDKNNFAPRLGIAYSPNAQTVFRGGYGVSYDQIFFNLISNVAPNLPRVISDTKFAPDTYNLYPNLPKITTSTVAIPATTTFFNFLEHPQNPTTHFYSFSIQRDIARTYVVEIGYSGNRSYHQIRQGELNYGVLTTGQAATVIATKNINSIPALQARRLNPAWGTRLIYDTTAGSYYNAMYLRFDKKLGHGLEVGANYTWSDLMSDNDDPLNMANLGDSSPALPQDFRNYTPEWSRSAYDRPHRFVAFYSYVTPRVSSHVGRQILSGWQVSGITEFQSGQPFTVRTGVDSIGNGKTDPSNRPDYNPAGVFLSDQVNGNLRTFTSPLVGGVFVTPLTTAGLPLANSMPFGGNLGRNTFRGPRFVTSNLSLSKTFSITERWKLRIRNDFYNLFNHRNFGPPENRMSAATFGQNTRDQVGDSSRNMLASVKLIF